jgi:hypothetical protein
MLGADVQRANDSSSASADSSAIGGVASLGDNQIPYASSSHTAASNSSTLTSSPISGTSALTISSSAVVSAKMWLLALGN